MSNIKNKPSGKVKILGIAADHGGFELKEFLAGELNKEGYEIVDFGNLNAEPGDDFPDYVIPLALAVASKEVDRGIAICGSGVGACIAANKISGVRACLITDTFSAHQGVEDDNMNLICMGGLITGRSLAVELVNTFLDAEFKGSERFQRRLAKISKLENNNLKNKKI